MKKIGRKGFDPYAFIKGFLLLTVGSIIYAVGVSIFSQPSNLAPGGVSGISIIINYLTDIPTGTMVFLINIPLLALALWKLGKQLFFSTLYATALSSVAMNLFSEKLGNYLPLTDDRLLAAVAAGVFVSLGIGLVYRGGGTTGGQDILVKFIRKSRPYMKTGRITACLDCIVIIASAIAFGEIEVAMYSAVTAVVSSFVMDWVLYGTDGAKLVFIVSSTPEPIAEYLLNTLEVGVTYLNGTGAYTGSDKRVIMCAVKKHLFPKIRNEIKTIDIDAFMIVSSATEIFGLGFKEYTKEDL